MFNPYSEKIYDYLGGIEDIRKAKVHMLANSYLNQFNTI
jgi:tRNA nucleotidyltransferase/poly(A) polymerase